jgi:vancomycin resistance protein VanW
LEVTEFHHHSDALNPDEGERVPFSAGTAVDYINMDYRFKNTTDQDVQLLTWCEGEISYAELRSVGGFPQSYRLVEENHHFAKEQDGKYYRISQIYREVTDSLTCEVSAKELVLDNRSEVLYDPALIPPDQIKG